LFKTQGNRCIKLFRAHGSNQLLSNKLRGQPEWSSERQTLNCLKNWIYPFFNVTVLDLVVPNKDLECGIKALVSNEGYRSVAKGRKDET